MLWGERGRSALTGEGAARLRPFAEESREGENVRLRKRDRRGHGTAHAEPKRWAGERIGFRSLILRRFPFGVVDRGIGLDVQEVAAAQVRRLPGSLRDRMGGEREVRILC